MSSEFACYNFKKKLKDTLYLILTSKKGFLTSKKKKTPPPKKKQRRREIKELILIKLSQSRNTILSSCVILSWLMYECPNIQREKWWLMFKIIWAEVLAIKTHIWRTMATIKFPRMALLTRFFFYFCEGWPYSKCIMSNKKLTNAELKCS